MDSLKTTPATNQAAQEEHRNATRAKSTTAHGPKSPQVLWCKSAVTTNGKTHPLPTTKEYILHSMQMSSEELELFQEAHTT